MDNKTYQKEASRTIAGDYAEIKRRMLGEISFGLVQLIEEISRRLILLDKFKKYVFYGKKDCDVDNFSKNSYWFSDQVGTPHFEIKIERTREILESEKSVNLLHGIVGTLTEAGEMVECFLNCPNLHLIDNVNMMEESGDIFWYLNVIADSCCFTFSDAMKKNIEKLKLRYKEKFTESEAIDRNLDSERSALEA